MYEWERVAEPQVDGYDSDVTLQALRESRYAERTSRTVPQQHGPVWTDGSPARWIVMADHMRPSSMLHDMDHTNAQVQGGLRLLETWPAVRLMCSRLLVALCPISAGTPAEGHGGTCGNFGDDWGWIYCTADNAWGFAEGIVHEVAHWKLRAFGIWFEDWTPRLIANSVNDRYVSPVRKDMPRPMGAVLHAQYSYIHVAQMCVRMLQATLVPTVSNYEWTLLQLQRITEGQKTLREHFRGTAEGQRFFEGMDAWTTRVIEEGTAAVVKGGLTL